MGFWDNVFGKGSTTTTTVPKVTTNVTTTGKLDPVLEKVYNEANKVFTALKQAGLSPQAASYATYQAYFESAAFTDYKYLQHNNPSGIKFAGQIGFSFGVIGAVKGNNGFAYFNTLADWARAMKHEVTKGTNPAGATTIEDYAIRLKNNGYFEANLNDYTAGLKRARLVLKVMPAADRAGYSTTDNTTQSKQDLDIPGTINYKENFSFEQYWDQLPPVGKGIAIAAAVVITKKLLD